MNRWQAVLFVSASLLVGCLNVADDRAELDKEIGSASVEGASIQVAGGLAKVRQMQPGELELWGQAPVLEATLGSGPATEWEIRLRNTLADAELTVTAPDGTATSYDSLEGRSPTERVWLVDGLQVDTDYSLRIAPPDADDASPWHFAVYADVQDSIDNVEDIYSRMAQDPELRFAVISGDLTEQGTPEQLTRFQRELQMLPIPAFATLGNHELGYNERIFRDYFGRGNFTFEFRDVRFTLLDSASATLAPQVYEWLEGWLDAGQGSLHAVFMHIPPFDPAGQRNGAFANRAEGSKLVRRFADHDVDLTVYGHIHSFYEYENAGIPSFITGGGGAIPQRFDDIGRHYVKVRVDPQAEAVETSVVRID